MMYGKCPKCGSTKTKTDKRTNPKYPSQFNMWYLCADCGEFKNATATQQDLYIGQYVLPLVEWKM